MKGIVASGYGPAQKVLSLQEIDKPEITDPEQVLVRVRAAGINPTEYHGLSGSPIVRPMNGWRRPREPRAGSDAAGVVEAVGDAVTHVRVGDEVFGARDGALAEYVVGKNFVAKPERLTFEQAGAIAVAASTALQGLRDKGGMKAGDRVLVNGASGGVGTYAVQIAKALGAHVTGVCSTRNVELVRSLGADEVVDYTQEDFVRTGPYDLILDAVGNRSLRACLRALVPHGRLVIVGAMGRGETASVLGALAKVLRTRLRKKRAIFFVASINKDDLLLLKDLVDQGKITPVIDRTYPLREAAQAIAYVAGEHARGKVVVTVNP